MDKSKKQTCSITPREARELRSKLHHLKPVIIIGNNGLTPAVLQEIDVALTAHELIKIRANLQDREQYADLTDKICSKSNATHIQTIGHIIAIYRQNPLEN